jgi:outer membrane lipopolysaccharide assembly protein LptE/RlpB
MTSFTARCIAGIAAIVTLTVVTPMNVHGQGQEKEPVALEAMAREADTPREHAQVAKQYRLRAEDFQAKAAKHEAAARTLRNNRNPMSHKWPAMANGGRERESQLAVQARRAAQECFAIADRHVSLAVESEHAVD